MRINIYSGKYINGIELFYLNGETEIYGSKENLMTKINLDPKTTTITAVHIHSDNQII